MSLRPSLSWLTWLLFLVPLFPLGQILLSGDAIGPWGSIASMVPGLAKGTPGQWNILNADSCLQFYVWRDLVFRAWGSGQMPFWNPYQLYGTPLLANSQSAAFYPFHILIGILHIPTSLGITLLAWLHLGWGGAGISELTKKLGGNAWGGFLAGALVILSPFFLAWTALPSVITTCAWIPWIWLAFFQEKPEWRIPGGAACIGMMVLGGHLQLAFYGILSVILLVAIQSAMDRERGWRVAATGALTVVLGLLLAFPQLGPVLKYSKMSHRQTVATEDGYRAYVRGAIRSYELIGLATPSILGQSTGISLRQDEGHIERMTGYWPAAVKPGGNYAESAIWIGPSLLLLLAGLKVSRREVGRIAMGTIAAVGLLLAIGSYANWPLYMLIPGWSATGSPGRASVLVVLAASVLAGLAFSQEVEQGKRKTYFPPLVLGAFALTAILLASTWGNSLAPWFKVALGPSVAEAMVDGLPWAVGGVALALGGWFALRKGQVILACGLFLAGHVLCVGIDQIPHGPPPPPTPTASSYQRSAFINGGWDLTRAYPALMPPNTATVRGRYDAGGYDSLLDRDTVTILRQIDGEDPAPPINGNMMFVKHHFLPEKLAESGVSQVLSRTTLPQLGVPESIDQTGGYAVYRLAGPGRAYIQHIGDKTEPAQISSDRLDGQTVQATGPGVLWIKDRMMDGWTASVDGKPTTLAAGLWREVQLPAGAHRVELSYSPPGLVSPWLSVGLLAGLIIVTRPKIAGRAGPKVPQI